MNRINVIFVFVLLNLGSNGFAQDSIIDSKTGITIIFSAQGRIFPETWYSDKISAKGKSLANKEYFRSETIVKHCILKYPQDLISQNLKTVYVLDEIEFFGQAFGGTNSRDAVYLSNKGKDNGYSNFYLEQLFHAEFSSILLRNFNYWFNAENWLRINPSDFDYGDGGVQALKDDRDSESPDKRWNKMGFINQYATSSMENDFNSFAKNLWRPREGFYNLVETYPAIKSKRELTIEFYQMLHSSLTKEFFDEILLTTKE